MVALRIYKSNEIGSSHCPKNTLKITLISSITVYQTKRKLSLFSPIEIRLASLIIPIFEP